MKNYFSKSLPTLVVLACIALFAGCKEEETGGYPVFYSDIVSCHIGSDSGIVFEQVLNDDKGSITLQPETPYSNENIVEGQRVLLQYIVNSTPSESLYNITVSQIGSVRSDTIARVSADSIASYPNDPIRLDTRWRTGAYINIDLQLEFYAKAHKLDLFYKPDQASPDTLDVILRHDRNGDAVGYWAQAYASFYVPEVLLPEYKAVRIYANMTNDAMGYTTLKLRD